MSTITPAAPTPTTSITPPSLASVRVAGVVLALVLGPVGRDGMAVIGIKVAVTGRWRGVLRAWPVVAETWALVVLPSLAIGGPEAAAWACGIHLLVGYTALGVLLAVRPELTRR